MTTARSRWTLPLFSVFLGLLFLVAQRIGGDLGGVLGSLGIMVAFAALLALGGRSETVRGLRGDGRDERFAKIDVHASAIAGTAVITAIIVAFLWEIAHGRDGNPYGLLGAIGGLSYLAAVIVLRWRG
jgi:hypothetical protein